MSGLSDSIATATMTKITVANVSSTAPARGMPTDERRSTSGARR